MVFGMSAVQTHFDLAGLRARRREILAYAAEHGARNVRVVRLDCPGRSGGE